MPVLEQTPLDLCLVATGLDQPICVQQKLLDHLFSHLGRHVAVTVSPSKEVGAEGKQQAAGHP